MTLPRASLLLALLSPSALLSQNTAVLHGTVYDDAGKPVAAIVNASKLSAPPATFTAQSGNDGAFTLTKLPAGAYMLCVRVPSGGYLDPCTWSPQIPSVQIAAGQTITGFRLVTPKGTIVKVRINDSAHVLGAAPAAHAVAPHVLAGVITRRHLLEPLALVATDAAGSDRQATIPPGEKIVLQVSGYGVQISDANGVPLNAAGSSVTLNQPASGPPAVVTFNVHGLGK